MQLLDALNDYKRHRGHRTRFPGERRSTTGRFSGRDGRLVHVARDGTVRDYGYPLSGLTGIERSRLGLRRGDEVTWFDDARSRSQRYLAGTTLVVTEHETERGVVTQYDLTLGDAHVTHVDASNLELEVDVDADADADADADELELVAFLGFAPDGRDERIGQLHHDDAVELYHAAEHDFVASATGFSAFRGQVPAKFDELLSSRPVDLPRPVAEDRYEEDRLSGNLVCFLPADEGSTTLATLLTDREETSREHALGRLDELTTAYASTDSLVRAAEAETSSGVRVPDDAPHADALRADLRVLDLLSGPTNLRIAGPDFDPYYAYSGGYGYTWFRDDAEISLFCLETAERFGLDLDDWHARSARAYCETQREDGSWPHRVWPRDGSLAPGWANGRLEGGDDVDYQADQTGSVIAYLGAYLDRASGDDDLAARAVESALGRALDGLDETLEADGRPVACQNAWEDATGRFAHTTATFLEAYASLAAVEVREETTLDSDVVDRAGAQADRVYDAVDDLWVENRGIYAVREYSRDSEAAEKSVGGDDSLAAAGDLDARCDSATLSLVAAHRTYARVGDVGGERVDRLVSHVRTVVDALRRTPASDVYGLVRYEGDDWRMRHQDDEKIWTVSTAWGAHAAASLAALLRDRGDDRAAEFEELARDLLALVLPGGPLCVDGGYLPEQVFDDGTPDSATPLGWPHALRLATVALMDEYEMLAPEPVVADD